MKLPEGSIGNGIVFDRAGRMFVADYTRHNVLGIDLRTRKIEVVVHEPRMNQPNDLAIAPDGTLYASDPSWKNGTGQLWRIDRKGGKATATLLAQDLGTTNGIEVSPDGKTLFVNESVQRKVWAWRITENGIADKRLVREFPDFGFDGMRCDVDGNLYITRHGKGTVVKMSPGGEILREINVLGTKPSNLCFGGSDGRTVYVTEVDHRRLVKISRGSARFGLEQMEVSGYNSGTDYVEGTGDLFCGVVGWIWRWAEPEFEKSPRRRRA